MIQYSRFNKAITAEELKNSRSLVFIYLIVPTEALLPGKYIQV